MNLQDPTSIPVDLRNQLDKELLPGERIQWVGQPIPGRQFGTASRWGIVIFAIPWTAFAVFWTSMAAKGVSKSHSAMAWAFPLFGVPFILVGVGMLTSPFWGRKAAGKLVYALTDRRAIIFRRGLRNTISVRSFDSTKLTDLTRNERPDGSGDLIFTRDVTQTSDSNFSRDVGFLGVRDVRKVEKITRDSLNKAKPQQSTSTT
jgi:hypothetical protein